MAATAAARRATPRRAALVGGEGRRSPVVFSPQEASVSERGPSRAPWPRRGPSTWRPRCARRAVLPCRALEPGRQRLADFGRASRSEDGSVIEAMAASRALPRRSGQPTFSHVDARKSMLGPAVHAPVNGRRPRRGTPAGCSPTSSEADVARVTTAPVRYDADFVFDLWRFRLACRRAAATGAYSPRPHRVRDHGVEARRSAPRHVLVRETAVSHGSDRQFARRSRSS